jgi:uncharacterized protein
MKVVLDTNILVSALLKPGGIEALVLLFVLQGRFEICVSPAVLAEYERVLRRPELKLNVNQVETVLLNIRKLAQVVYPTAVLAVSLHESDNRFYECAQVAEADYLVTGNRRHFTRDLPPTKIVSARELLLTLA